MKKYSILAFIIASILCFSAFADETEVATSLTLKTVGERVNVNSVRNVYAIVTPSHLKEQIEWSSSDESIVLIDDDGSFCALSEGTATVTASVGGLTESIDINVIDKDGIAWFSQHLTADGGWRGDDLKDVYFYSGVHERYIINGYNRNIDWMDEGCAVTSVAMVLYNMGARLTEGYDFRFEKEGNLEVDPYVASLGNSNNYGLTTSSGTIYGNPISLVNSAVSANFTLHGRPIKVTQYNYVTKQAIKEQLDKHPEGVIVGMRKPGASHYIVFTECLNPEAAPSDYRFMMYDSAGLRRSQGDYVTFEQSISYASLGYRFASMTCMRVIDIVPES